jgi:hypothetical protein
MMNAPSNSLYILSGEYLAIANKLSDSDMPPEVIADTLESLSGELEEKAVNVALFVRNLEATAESIKAAEKQMADRRKSLESKAESIRRYLKDNMQRTGISKIECPYFALTIKKNPPSVVIDDASLLPVDYMVTPPPPPAAPDKKLIAQAIKDGYEVPGAHLEQGERLEIK